jgi:hypothetical protein
VFAPTITVSAAGSLHRWTGAAFQFPLIDGNIGWLYSDTRSNGTDPSGDHTGIDVYPPTANQAADVYPLAFGYLKEVDRANHSFEVYYPDTGVTSYMAHVNLVGSLGNDSPVYPNQSIGTLLVQNDKSGGPNTHIHLSVKFTGLWSHYNDQQSIYTAGAAQDPSDYFNANLRDHEGTSNPVFSSYPYYRKTYQDFCRASAPLNPLPGSTNVLSRTILTPKVPVKPDVMLLADTTGSMGGEIADVRSKAASVMTQVLQKQSNAWFGAAEYKDFNCDARPFAIDQPLTSDTSAVQNQINGNWFAGGGCDTPESQLNALYQLATNTPAAGWRSDSSRIIAWFGDAPGHDPSNGHTLSDAISALQAAKIRVIAVDAGSLDGCGSEGFKTCNQATAITNATSGRLLTLATAAEPSKLLADAETADMAIATTTTAATTGSVADAILEGLTTLPVTIVPDTTGCANPYVQITASPSSITVNPGDSATFSITISVVAAVPAATQLHCDIGFLLNGTPVSDSTIVEPIVILAPFSSPDTTPPTTQASLSQSPNAAGWINKDVQFTLSATDNGGGSGVSNTYFGIDNPNCSPSGPELCSLYTGPVSVNNEGIHTVTFFSVDRAGNTESAQSLTIRLDKTPPTTKPTITGKLGKNMWYVGPATVALGSSDSLSGVATTRYSTDGGSTWQIYTTPFVLSKDGKFPLEFQSSDMANNVENIQSIAINIDQTPPTVSCSTTPVTLWPPNHKLVNVVASVTVQDSG